MADKLLTFKVPYKPHFDWSKAEPITMQEYEALRRASVQRGDIIGDDDGLPLVATATDFARYVREADGEDVAPVTTGCPKTLKPCNCAPYHLVCEQRHG